jgi:hypothetical protein
VPPLTIFSGAQLSVSSFSSINDQLKLYGMKRVKWYHVAAKRGRNWLKNNRWILSISVSSIPQGPLACHKILRHEAYGFTSPPKEVVLRIFIALKNPSLTAGFEPANLGANSKHDNHSTIENDLHTHNKTTGKTITYKLNIHSLSKFVQGNNLFSRLRHIRKYPPF